MKSLTQLALVALAGLAGSGLTSPAQARFVFANSLGQQGSYQVNGTLGQAGATITITGGAAYSFTASGSRLTGAFVGGFDFVPGINGAVAGGAMTNVNVAADWIPYGDYEQQQLQNNGSVGQNTYGSDVFDNGYVKAVSGTTQKIVLWNTRMGTTNGIELTLNVQQLGLTDNGTSTFTFTNSTSNDNACATASPTLAASGNFCGNTNNNLSGLNTGGQLRSVAVPVPSPGLLLGLLPVAQLLLRRRNNKMIAPTTQELA